MEGHFARDKKCGDNVAAAYQAKLRQHVAGGGGGGGVEAAHGLNAPQQITYQDTSARIRFRIGQFS